MKRLAPIASSLLFISFALSGCETPGESAGAGAATGALIGAAATGRPIDVLRGAAAGAAAGYLVGKVVQHDRREEDDYYYGDDRDHERDHDRDRYDDRDHDYRRDDRYPVARPTHHEGYVISPYYPHNRIDVRGIPSGAKVMDPSTNRVFINP